jgi:hypothetical protein
LELFVKFPPWTEEVKAIIMLHRFHSSLQLNKIGQERRENYDE